MPKLSIIVPIYKVEKYLDECVQSVLSQSFGDYECVLVDDGSPDNCPAMCDEYARQQDKIKVIHKENGGLSDARNAGILQASGEYIVLLDSDDKFADDNALQNLFDVIQKYKTDVVVNVNFFTFTDNGEKKLFDRYDKNIAIASPNCVVDSFDKAFMYMAGCFYVLNREYLIKNDLFFKMELLLEDVHWMPRVLFTTQKIAVNHSPFYAYRVGREGSITSVVSIKRLFDTLSIIDDLFEWSKDEKMYDKMGRGYMVRRAKELLHNVYYALLESKHIKQQSKKDYCHICKELQKRIKKIPYFYWKKHFLLIVVLGVDNTDILLKFYGKMRNTLLRNSMVKGLI